MSIPEFSKSLVPSEPNVSPAARKIALTSADEAQTSGVVLHPTLPQVIKTLGEKLGFHAEAEFPLQEHHISQIKDTQDLRHSYAALLGKMGRLLEVAKSSDVSIKSVVKGMSTELAHLRQKMTQLKLSKQEAVELEYVSATLQSALSSAEHWVAFEKEYAEADEHLENTLSRLSSEPDSILGAVKQSAPRDFAKGLVEIGQLLNKVSAQVGQQGPYQEDMLQMLQTSVETASYASIDFLETIPQTVKDVSERLELHAKATLERLNHAPDDYTYLQNLQQLEEINHGIGRIQQFLSDMDPMIDKAAQSLVKRQNAFKKAYVGLEDEDQRKHADEIHQNLVDLRKEMRSFKANLPRLRHEVAGRMAKSNISNKLAVHRRQIILNLMQDDPQGEKLDRWVKPLISAVPDEVEAYANVRRKLQVISGLAETVHDKEVIVSPPIKAKILSLTAEIEQYQARCNDVFQFDQVLMEDMLLEEVLREAPNMADQGHWAWKALRGVVKNITTPAEWTPATKRMVHSAFVGLQLSADVASTYQKLKPLPQVTVVNTSESQPSDSDKDVGVSDKEVTVSVKAMQATASKMVHAGLEPAFNPVSSATAQQALSQQRKETLDNLQAAAKKTVHIQKNLERSKQPLDNIEQLKKDVARLHAELLGTLESGKQCAPSEFMQFQKEANALCFSVADMEQRLAASMAAAKVEIIKTASKGMQDEQIEESGMKHANLVRQAWLTNVVKIPGLKVPVPFGVSSQQMQSFLEKETPQVFEHWRAIGALYAQESASGEQASMPFLDKPEVVALLGQIDHEIETLFTRAGKDDAVFKSLGLSTELQNWLEEIRTAGKFLMVRSTGAEDSRKLANAGGNTSKAYVPATREGFCQAAGEVLRSYFGASSLQNRLNAKINPFEQNLKLAVTSQELIGEPIGGAARPSDIPISLVLFSNEPLYIGGEKFRVMRLSASYGHGEGVVGNLGIAADTALILQSEAHPDQLYVHYDNREKPVRLAPVRTAEGVVLEKVANPPELVKKPALNAELLTRLYHWGVVGEKFFDDYPTDMEIVIRDGIIYPVQARPINRPELLPTYLDLRKVAALDKSPILSKSQGEMIVPGQASVEMLTKKEEILIAETLEQAEKLYPRGKYKVVVVHQEELANTHPVVNFSGLGVPCLYIKNKQEVQTLVSQISEKQPLAVCVQTATLNLWNQAAGSLEQFVSKGFAVHPAKIAISLPVQNIPAKAALIAPAVPQEVRDLYLEMRAATTKQTALAKLKALKAHGWITQVSQQRHSLARRLKEASIVPKPALAHFAVLEELDDKLSRAFQEMEAVIKSTPEGGRLQPLLHAKVLDTLLFTPPSKDGRLAAYSVMEVAPVVKGTEVLINYQKALAHPAHLADILLEGTAAFTPERFENWYNFLLQLEPLIEKGEISTAQVARFKELMLSLRETGAFASWQTLFFNPISSWRDFLRKPLANSAKDYFQSILADVKDSDLLLLRNMQVKQQELLVLRNQIGLFSEPDKFPKAWEALQNQAALWLPTAASDGDMMKGASPIAAMAVIKMMQELTDVFDLSIKALKGNAKLDQVKKLELFKVMIKSYFALLQGWSQTLDGSKAIPMHSYWTLPKYMAELESQLNAFMPKLDPALLEPSKEFSVSAAALGSTAVILRHSPQSLEDFYTLTHQNILACLSSTFNQLIDEERIQQAGLPPLVNYAMRILSETHERTIQRMGVEVNEANLIVKYNIPLSNHGGIIELHYDKATKTLIFKGKILGAGVEQERWEKISTLINLLEDAHLFPANEKNRLGEQEVSFSWQVVDKTSLGAALEEYLIMTRLSLDDMDLGYITIIESLLARCRQRGLSGKLKAFANEFAKQMITGTHAQIRDDVLYLIATLIENGELHDYAVATELAKNIFTSSDIFTASDKEKRAKINLLRALVEKGQGFDIVIGNLEKFSTKSPEDKTTPIIVSMILSMISQGKSPQIFLDFTKNTFLAATSPPLERVAINLIKVFIQKGESIDVFIEVVRMGISKANHHHLAKYFSLLNVIVEAGYGKEAAAEIAQKAFASGDDFLIRQSMSLQETLCRKGIGYDVALEMAKAFPYSRAAIDLMKVLIEKGKGLETILEVARNGLKENNQDVRLESMSLVTALAEKGINIENVIKIAEDGLTDSSDNIRYASFDLMLALIKKGSARDKFVEFVVKNLKLWQSFDIDIVRKGIIHSDPDIRRTMINMLVVFLEKHKGQELDDDTLASVIEISRQAFEDADELVRKQSASLLKIIIAISSNLSQSMSNAKTGVTVDHSFRNVKWSSTILITFFVQTGTNLDTGLRMFRKGIIDTDPNVRQASVELMDTLIRRDKGFEVFEALVEDYLSADSPSVRTAGFDFLMQNLQKNPENTNIFIEIAKKGIRHSNEKVRLAAIDLSKLMVSKEIGIAEAIEIAKLGFQDSSAAVKSRCRELVAVYEPKLSYTQKYSRWVRRSNSLPW